MSAGSWFHACGAATENDLEPNVVRVRGMSNCPLCAERRWDLPDSWETGTIMSVKYCGAYPNTTPCIKVHNL